MDRVSDSAPPFPTVSSRLSVEDDPAVSLYVRGRVASVTTSKVALFVHGATLSSVFWDLPRPGRSWLARAASRGWAAHALDIRGYGRSSGAAAMRGEPGAAPPYASASSAILDIDAAVEWLREAYGVDRVSLIGGSWGSITTALYASGLGRGKIDRLLLYAPIFSDHNAGWLDLIADPKDPSRVDPDLGAYRWVTEAATRARWDGEIPVSDPSDWRDPALIPVLMADLLAADPEGAARPEPAFRAPNGTLLDLFEAFNRRPLYDPKALEVPVFMIRGDSDPTSTHADASGLFERLGSGIKRYCVIGHGAHFVLGERNGWQVIAEGQAFLDAEF